ncbi:helix-turn-helix domain-containing protein [Paenibacillus provencensis]|uniref:Helix-turn-helix domain-containing protein n=1 Tax=Paenibacillus provencensis TaxID=441151 RepID=A0ABW3PQ66_9BACL
MIKCNLAEILARKGLKIKDVAKHTGISRTTLTALSYNHGKGVQFDTMDQICEFLDIDPGELFTFYKFRLVVNNVEKSSILDTYLLDCEIVVNSDVYKGYIFAGYISKTNKFAVVIPISLLNKLEEVPNNVLVDQVFQFYQRTLYEKDIKSAETELAIFHGSEEAFLKIKDPLL